MERFGLPAAEPNVYLLGGGDWWINWSPQQIHPYALQWLQWASAFGPSPAYLPPPDVWHYGLLTRDISD